MVGFRGFVAPKGVRINYIPPNDMKIQGGMVAWVDAYWFKIENSVIEMRCKLKEPLGSKNVSELYMECYDIIRATTDLFSFAMGIGLTPILDTFLDEKGNPKDAIAGDKNLSSLCTSYKVDAPFEEILILILRERLASMALNDLIISITMTNYGQVNCGRAVESLRSLLADPGKDRGIEWSQMQEKLNVDEAYLKFITDHSVDARHGRRDKVKFEVLAELNRRAWVLLDRFIAYRGNGNQPLLPDRFPLLKG